MIIKVMAMIFVVVQLVSALETTVWDLEDYNGWNLPFAKTVQIEGIKNTPTTDSNESDHLHYLSASSYKLEVDTSALFSVLFVDKDTFTDYETGDLVELDYTFLGDVPMLKTEGVWTDV